MIVITNRIVPLLLFIWFSFSQSQTKRFYYQFELKFDNNNKTEDILVLEINKDKTLFISNEYLVVDSINNFKNNRKFAYPNFRKIIKKNKKTNENLIIENLSSIYYLYEANNKLDWELIDEKKNYGEFIVQKAETKYGGRIWTAWFTPEIPFQEGPYLFHGLPGLVLEVYDKNLEYHFKFIKNKNYLKEIDSEIVLRRYLANKLVKIQEYEFKKIQEDYYKNPLKEYYGEEAMMLKDNGRQYTFEELKAFEKTIKEALQKYNNPINLDYKPSYKD